MKKRLIIPAMMMACVLALSACGSSDVEQESQDSEDIVSSAAETAAISSDEVEGAPVRADSSDTDFTDATIEETELYNADGITVTATEFNANGYYGPEIEVRIQNESDVTVDIIAQNVAVNGYMLDPGLLYVEAMPGDTIEEEISLYDIYLDARGIDTVATVALTIEVMDAETYEEIGTGDRITLTTSAAEGYSQPVDDSGDVILDEDGVRVVSQGLKQDDNWAGDLVLYIENDTDMFIGVSCTDIYINGKSEDDNVLLWADLYADTRIVTGMYLMDIEDLDIESIADVKEISFQLMIMDQDDMEVIYTSDPITLNFE